MKSGLAYLEKKQKTKLLLIYRALQKCSTLPDLFTFSHITSDTSKNFIVILWNRPTQKSAHLSSILSILCSVGWGGAYIQRARDGVHPEQVSSASQGNTEIIQNNAHTLIT